MRGHAETSEGHVKSASANHLAGKEAADRNGLAQFQSPSVIQRYSIVQPDNLKAQKNATVETQSLDRTRYGSTYSRTSHSVDETGFNPQTQATTTESVSRNQQTQVSGLPSFKVSQKGLMALPAEGQAKNFYTTAENVTNANQAFKDNGSRIRLKSEGHGITVPKKPHKPSNQSTNLLKKVHAAMEVPNQLTQQLEVQIQQTLPFVQCNDFVDLVIGATVNSSRVAVLQNQQTQSEVQAPEGGEPVKDIATHISRGNNKPSEVKHKLTNQPLSVPEKETGLRDYENLEDDVRSGRARKIGVNEFVNPQVGEGMVIRSSSTNERLDREQLGTQNIAKPQINAQPNSKSKRKKLSKAYTQYLQELDQANNVLNKSRSDVSYVVQQMMRTWGEHYAGVVGRDGVDMVTLENYNRSTEISWEHERIFNNLFTDFAEFRFAVTSRVDSLNSAPDNATVQQLVALAAQAPNLSEAYANALQEAVTSFQTGMQQTAETYQGNFYFQMYGPGEQSFHEEFKGIASNPVTLHIKEKTAPLIQPANDGIQDLHNTIARWETPILAHPMNGPAQNALLLIIQNARAVEQQATLEMATAQTRGDYNKVIIDTSEAWNTFTNAIRDGVRGSYQVITGNAPQPAINSMADIVARCAAFRGTYYWFNSADAPYNNSIQLEAIAQALIAVGIP